MSTILIGKILIFHQLIKIIKFFEINNENISLNIYQFNNEKMINK